MTKKRQKAAAAAASPAPVAAPAAPTFARESVAIAELSEAEYNPRQIGEEELAALKASLQTFGMVQEVVVNRGLDGKKRTIVSGHQRVRAAREIGWSHVPVVYVSLDEQKEKALCVVMNSRKVAGSFTTALVDLLDEIELDLGLAEDLRLDDLAVEAALIVDDETLREVEQSAQQAASGESADAGPAAAVPPPPPEGSVRDTDAESQGMVQFAVPVNEEQLQLIRRTVAAAKKRNAGLDNAGALAAICSAYLENK